MGAQGGNEYSQGSMLLGRCALREDDVGMPSFWQQHGWVSAQVGQDVLRRHCGFASGCSGYVTNLGSLFFIAALRVVASPSFAMTCSDDAIAAAGWEGRNGCCTHRQCRHLTGVLCLMMGDLQWNGCPLHTARGAGRVARDTTNNVIKARSNPIPPRQPSEARGCYHV